MGFFSGRKQSQTLEEYIASALQHLKTSAPGSQVRFSFGPNDVEVPAGSWWSGLPGEVAQALQDSGYFIEWAETVGQRGVVVVNVPLNR